LGGSRIEPVDPLFDLAAESSELLELALLLALLLELLESLLLLDGRPLGEPDLAAKSAGRALR
jgi:hypothetical protein